MYDYQTILKRKTGIPDETEIRKDIESADSWEDAYWIGRCVYAQGAGESDKLVMDACAAAEIAFSPMKGPPGTACMTKNVTVMTTHTVTIASRILFKTYFSVLEFMLYPPLLF